MPDALFTTATHDGVAPLQNLKAALQPQIWQKAASYLAAARLDIASCPCPASPLELWQQLHTACTDHSAQPYDTLEFLGSTHSTAVALVNVAASLDFSIEQAGDDGAHSSLLQTVAGLKSLDSSFANISIWPHVTSSSTQPHATNHEQSSSASVMQVHSLLQQASQQLANSVDNQPAVTVHCCLQVDLALAAAWSLLPGHSSAQEPTQTLSSGLSPPAIQQAAQQDEGGSTGMGDDMMLQSLAQLLRPLASLLRDLVAATDHAVRSAVQQHPKIAEMPDKASEVLQMLRLDLNASQVSA